MLGVGCCSGRLGGFKLHTLPFIGFLLLSPLAVEIMGDYELPPAQRTETRVLRSVPAPVEKSIFGINAIEIK